MKNLGSAFLLFVIVGFTSFTFSSAEAAHTLPLIASCELLLKSDLGTFVSNKSSLTSVRDVRISLETVHKIEEDEGTPYDTFLYSGPVKSMESEKVESAILRLKAIEEQLQSTGLKADIVSFEVRGKQIAAALAKLEERQAQLEKLYQAEYERVFDKTTRNVAKISGAVAFGVTMSGLAAFSAAHGVHGFADHGALSTFIVGVAAAGLDLGYAYLAQEKFRIHSEFEALKKALTDTQDVRHIGEFFISSENVKLMEDVNRDLLSGEKPLDLNVRQAAIEEFGGDFFTTLTKSLLTGSFQNTFHRKTTYAYLDHIVYYDSFSKEPVWLFFYRSFQEQPGGGKKIRKQSAVGSKEWNPSYEGQMVPVPIPIPVDDR